MLRATLKSLLSRKLRLVLSGLAVVLGVMAVSASLVLTNTLNASFTEVFATANQDIDVQVSGPLTVSGDEEVSAPVPADLIDELSAIDGVASAHGVIEVPGGARPVGSDGKVIPSQGPPRMGVSWNDADSLIELREGSPPRADDEVAINALLAEEGDFSVGDQIGVITLEPFRTFTISGIFGYRGGRDSLGGEFVVAFTERTAQLLLLGQSDVYSAVNLVAADGVSPIELRDRVRAVLEDAHGPDRYVVRTGEEVAEAQAADVQEFLRLFRNMLLGFAAITLFVGVFLILNTFSILVAQRTRELALLRSLGAKRSQIIRSVLLEAIVVGALASTLGLLAGIGLAAGLRQLFDSLIPLPGPIVTIPVSAVIAAYIVGILVTIVAALLPALRASRVAPIVAMRQAATPDRPLTRLTIAGVVVTALAVAVIGLALYGDLENDTTVALLAGVLLAFVGVAMLTPLVARPAVSLLGRLVSWNTPAKLGRRNSGRNPRRTAITAATLMIGMALVTGVSVIASSLSASLERLIKVDISADLIIRGEEGLDSLPTYDPAVIDQITALPDVTTAVALYGDYAQETSTGTNLFFAATDMEAYAQIFELPVVSGEVRSPQSGEIIIPDVFATQRRLEVGSTLEVSTARGGVRQFEVIGIYEASMLVADLYISVEEATESFRTSMPYMGFVVLRDGADVEAAEEAVAALLADSPEVSVVNQNAFADQQTRQVDQMLNMLYLLLTLALVIAILGIINTLLLAVLERTRELGMLRAIGLGRLQTVQMITVESVVITVFGAILGIAVGTGLGVAVVRALKEQGFQVLSLPWARLGVFLGVAVVAGLFAAVIPAIRAARTNVLQAIAYE